MSRKPNGKEAAKRYSVRLEKETYEKICREYGTLRQALESLADPILIKDFIHNYLHQNE